MELDAIPQPELEQIERIGGADLVIGIIGSERPEQNGSAAVMVLSLIHISEPTRH